MSKAGLAYISAVTPCTNPNPPIPVARAVLITIGNELLVGKTVNTNAAWLGQRLTDMGVDVVRNVTIPDVAAVITAELDAALDTGAGLVLLTGGLGATKDDITKKVLAQYFGMNMAVHQPTLERITAYFEMRGRKLNALTATHAQVPDGCLVLDNAVGAAPGMVFHAPGGALVASFPGVPYELKYLFEHGLEPVIRAQLPPQHIRHRTFCTVGVPESNLAQRLRHLEDALPPAITLAYNPTVQVLRLRLTLNCPVEQAASLDPVYDAALADVQQLLALDCYGYEDDTLEGVLGQMLRQRGLTLATAESCTGGAVSARLCSVSGASDYILANVVSYANQAKVQLLGVQEATLAEHGAVSEAVAIEMAQGIRRLSGASIGLSTTGVAGPTGGTVQKPVGTVWIGYADDHTAFARPYRFEADRARNIERSVVSALDLARRHLLESAAGGAEG